MPTLKEEIGVSVASVYNKLNGIEVNTSAELVRYAAGAATPIIEGLKGTRRSALPGYRVKLLDGNCIEASAHRIADLRKLSAFRKHPRGPKKPVVKRKKDPKKPHVSTAKLIASRKK